MTHPAFHPQQLTGHAASLNHVVLGPLGAPDVNGRLAQDACSRDAVLSLATAHGLGALRRGHLADDLGTALASADPARARRAMATLHTFRLRLGNLIATLRDPATAAAQGASTARRAFFDHCLSCRVVQLS